MNYQECLDFLYSQLPMYQRSGKAAYKASLDNTLELDRQLGHPHRRFSAIHVAGTNGKGSVSHLLASILQEAGLRTGLYTSPHLLDFRERIRVNGAPIAREKVVGFVRDHQELIRKIRPSFFEMTVALSFLHFAEEAVEVAVVETGMGGRLDSTNILDPQLSIITNISMDHAEFLGPGMEEIAAEKGGIIKEGRPLVLGMMDAAAEAVLRTLARERSAPLSLVRERYAFRYQTLEPTGLHRFSYEDLASGEGISHGCALGGSYQQENLATVLTALPLLRQAGYAIPAEAVKSGLEKVVDNTGILGRWHILGANPRRICDTAHNPAGIRAVVEQIRQTPYRHLHMVWGMVGDKDLEATLPLLPREARYYFCQAQIPRSMRVDRLREAAAACRLKGSTFPSVPEAYAAALEQADERDLVYVGGSTFVVADLLAHLYVVDGTG